MKISTRFSNKYSFSFCLLILTLTINTLSSQSCPTLNVDGIFNPETDVLMTSYHQSMAKTTTGFVAWGEDMAASGANALAITEITPANGYTYTGTPLHFALSGNSDGQGFLATTSSLYAWGGVNEVVDLSFVSGPAFNDMALTQALPFNAADITQMHASSDVLFVVSAGQIWVASTFDNGVNIPASGNASTNGDIWQQVQTSIGVPLTGVMDVTGNKYAGYALLSNGDIYTWGTNVVLGNGTPIQNLDYATLMTAPPSSIVDIASFTHNQSDTGLLALGTDTKVYGVGDNTLGEIITTGTGVVTSWFAIEDGLGNDITDVLQVSTSETSEEWSGAAIITRGPTPSDPNLLYTWGLNNQDSIGQGAATIVQNPTIPPSFNQGTDDPVFVSVGGHATTFFNRAGGGSICFVGHITDGSTGGLTTGTGATFECVIPATVELCASAFSLVANNDEGNVIEGIGGIAVSNVLTNDRLNASVPTTSDVNLTQISTTNAGITLNDIDGSINVTAAVPYGIYYLVYEICETSNPTNCETATVTVFVNADRDSDGIDDIADIDSDNDGILNSFEGCGNTTDIANTVGNTGIGSPITTGDNYALVGTNITYNITPASGSGNIYGGAIQEAGAVKSNKIKKGATSDFMEIERQRGISVATSVLAFEYDGIKVNILDTPGHKDFAEDTFRTLTAVDSVIVVIDVAKGVEEQTEKLVEVCRMRNIPMIVFINKLDREGKDAFDLLDEVEQKLGLKVTPLSFPIGMGYDFKGIYNLWEKNINLFSGDSRKNIEETIEISDLNSDSLNKLIGEKAANQLRENIELVEGIYPSFNKDDYLKGNLQPVFFGSALNNFGVRELLDCFVDIAPKPRPKQSEERLVKPEEDKFTGFVFKIHANMDPNHRDRLAFIKIVSGQFRRNTPYLHVRHNKKLKFSSPNAFFAEKKEIVDVSYPGDIVGLHDTGNFKIGDTLTEGEVIHYKGIPSFSPEHFRYINNADPLKAKQLYKGIDQLMDEGVAQLFTLEMNGRKVIGTVGALQYEVIQYRLEHEYGAKCTYENLNVHKACWVSIEDKKSEEFKDFLRVKQRFLARDKQNQLVFFADSAFSLQMTQQKYPSITFHFTSEFEK